MWLPHLVKLLIVWTQKNPFNGTLSLFEDFMGRDSYHFRRADAIPVFWKLEFDLGEGIDIAVQTGACLLFQACSLGNFGCWG